ncbi:PD-(D/E)XK nuclease family protein, partial [Gardnerella pickettii]
ALRDEPFIKALFAIIELAQFSQKSVDDLAKSVHSGNYTLYSIAHFVRSRIKTVLESPLVDSGDYNCADLAAVDSLMRSICSLSEVISGANKSGENSPLSKLIEQWEVLSNRILSANEPSTIESASVMVDNRVFNAQPNANSTQFSIESCYILILKAFIDGCSSVAGDSGDSGDLENEEAQGVKSTEIFSVLQKMRPNSVHTRALMRVFNIVLRLSKNLKNNLEKVKNSGENQVSYVLSKAWNLCNCAKKWQIQALSNNDEGRAANDRLDAAMRLFEYANSFSYTVSQSQQMPNGGSAGPTIAEFIDQVRQMEIEADSLASVAPLPDAVTLTTPSGSVGRTWDYVWIPAVQQRVWPNTAARSTMFASETLVDIVLNSRILSGESGDGDSSDITYFFDAYSKNPNGICVSDKQAIFTGEQRSLLMAITRARKHLCVSAVNSDDCVPSDFLYYYLPEIYWRNQDGSCDYTDFCGDFAAVDADARGLVCASRITLAKQESGSKNSDSLAQNPTIQDALNALNLLKNNGVDAANPDNWDFMRKNYDSAIDSAAQKSQATAKSQEESQEELPLKSQEKSQEKSSTNKTLVTLSPSMVDKLWSCPVCCLLESKFAGPAVGSTAAQFGTLIHETARWASQDEHLDNDYLRKNYPQLQAFVSGFVGNRAQEFADFDFSFDSFSALQKKAIEDVANKMIEHYYSICPSDSSISNVKDRYRFIKNDLNVRRALYTISQYFVGSLNGQNYPILVQKDEDGVVTKILPAPEKSKTAKPTIADVPLGSLEEAYCECQINATFGFDDILNAYNLVAKTQTSLEDLYSIMGFLVGGWPNGGSCDLRVRIQGRIDRMELRKLNDNTQQIRLIDYKTGKVPNTQQVFNDLQLICYQLGIVFCSENNKDYEQLLKLKHTKIARSALFHVVYKDSPAQDNGVAENICQPSLFDEDGSLSASEILSRYRYSNNNRLYDLPSIDAQNPAQGVSQSAWADFVKLPMRAKWSLMMISRVFFAAAAVKSTSFAVEPKADHKNYCRCLDVCPACAEKVDTVYEVIEGKNEQ